jgi:hypothetical protein
VVNGSSSSRIGVEGAPFLIFPDFTSRAFSAAIRFSNSDAGSSFGSCGTSLPHTARLRMVWRSCLIWSARAVRAGRASRAKRASSRKVSGSGALGNQHPGDGFAYDCVISQISVLADIAVSPALARDALTPFPLIDQTVGER